MYTRRNVWNLGGEWADTILWYARGVAKLKARAIADPTSWDFFGAIHGIDPKLWSLYGYLPSGTVLPSTALQQLYWNQCQHGSWYFLPWHRGYLLAIEQLLRKSIVDAGGPQDWAMPYWNYFDPGQSALPPAFASADWPDGTGNNPLFVPQRWGPDNNGNVYVPQDQVNMLALNDPDFTGVRFGGSPGFGGVDTGFSHSGRVHGGIETQPHDYVHVLVGGANPNDPDNQPGLMSYPPTAGLDPIFWLHHANIDRLWQVWIELDPRHQDPDQKAWLDGPTGIGERHFVMPTPTGQPWYYTPQDMSNISALGYTYDNLAPIDTTPTQPAAPSPAPVPRFGAPQLAATLALESLRAAPAGATDMSEPRQSVMMGASNTNLPIRGQMMQTSVSLQAPLQKRSPAALETLAVARETAPGRVLLNLENVRGTADATALRVYLGLPDGAAPEEHPERLAGSIGLFGVKQASDPDGDHAGQGITYVLDVSHVIASLNVSGSLSDIALPVTIVPNRPVSDAAGISIGRVSLYQQPG